MPNLMMSSAAARGCYARAQVGSEPIRKLGWDDFIHVLDFYEQSGIARLSLVDDGLASHPDLPDMLDYALWRDFDTRVSTSGMFGEQGRARLARVIGKHSKDRIRFVVRAPRRNAPDGSPSDVAQFLELVGSSATLSASLDGPTFDIESALELISKFRLDRRLRFTLDLPDTHEADGATPIAPYRSIADALEATFPRFRETGVVPMFGCGFPTCMFTDAQLGGLTKLGAVLNPTCDPMVEIGPELELWPGLPIAELRALSLYDFQQMTQVVDRFRDTLSRHRVRAGMLSDCESCDIRARDLCSGGCLAHQFSEVPVEQVHSAPSRRHLPLA